MVPTWAASTVGDILISEADLHKRVGELGRQITAAYAGRGRPLVLVGVLKGVAYFLSDLLAAIGLPVQADYMALTRYGPPARGGGGHVRLLQDLATPIGDCDVLLVEDVIDTGLPQGYLLRHLQAQRPASLHICTLLDRQSVRLLDLPLAYVGFQVPDRFLIGYGLDLAEQYRNLPFIATLQPEVATPGYWS